MQLFFDTDLRQLVQGFGSRAAVSVIEIKDQDTLRFDVYAVAQGIAQDLTDAAAMKFGLFAAGTTTPALVLTTSFPRMVDTANNVFYRGIPVFLTAEMVTAMGDNASILCTGEIRVQLPDGEIIHCLDIPFRVDRTLLDEAGVTPPEVVSTYPDVSLIELKANKGQANGYVPLDSGILIPVGFLPVVPLANLAAGVELSANRNTAGGYPSLDSQSLLSALQIPADGATLVVTPSIITRTGTTVSGSPIVTGLSATADLTEGEPVTGTGIPGGTTLLSIDSPSQITLSANATAAGTPTLTFTTQKLSAVGPAQGVISITQSNFTVPSVGGTQTINAPNGSLTAGLYYNISGGAGAYQFISATDATHGLFLNLGGAANAAPGTVISFPVNITWSGPPGPASGGGIVAFVRTAFTVPTVGNTVGIDVDDAAGFPFEALVTIKVGGSNTTYGPFMVNGTGTGFLGLANDARWSINAGGDVIPVGSRIVLVDFHAVNPHHDTLSGHQDAPTAKTYCVILSAFVLTGVQQIAIQTLSGTCTASLNHNGTPITGLGAIAVTSTPQTLSAGNEWLSVGDRLDLVISAPSSPVDLDYSIDINFPPSL